MATPLASSGMMTTADFAVLSVKQVGRPKGGKK